MAAYAENVAIVNGDAATIENAVALCWLLHLVGDVHQSLHTEAFLHECSAELVRRLETAGVRFAA